MKRPVPSGIGMPRMMHSERRRDLDISIELSLSLSLELEYYN